MKGFNVLSILFVLTITLFSVNVVAGDRHRIQFEVLDTGNLSGVDHQMIMVADRPMLFEHLWHMHKKDGSEPVPYVDFEKYVVVAHFLGNSASCGYDIEVTKIKEKKHTVQIKSEVKVPVGPIQCLIAEQPFEIVKMPRSTKTLSFKQSIETDD